MKPLWDSEEAMLRQFRERAHIYTEFVKDQLTTVDALSIMQHHGAPTRLLDWTYSPAVAAFFAAADDQKSTCATVWAVNQSKIRYWSNYVYQTELKSHTPVAFPGPHPPFGRLVHAKPLDLDFTIRDEEIDFSDEKVFSLYRLRDYSQPHIKIGLVASVSPTVHNARLVNQQGVFLANFDLDRSLQESMESMLKNCDPPAIKRFDFPRTLCDEILRSLMAMSVHYGVLYPDLTGLCLFVRLHWTLHLPGDINLLSR